MSNKIPVLNDYKKVKELSDLYRALDYYSEMYEAVSNKIRALGATMSANDIRYAIKESEK